MKVIGRNSVRLVAASAVAGIAVLQGCSFLPNELPTLGGSTQPQMNIVQHAGQTRPRALVVLAPITGPTGEVSQRLIRHLDAAATRANLALMNDAGATGTYRLQGHMLASRQKNDVILSYVWNVNANDGTRRGQVSGAETVAGGAANPDSWAAIPDAMLQSLAEKVIVAVVTGDAPALSQGGSEPMHAANAPVAAGMAPANTH